MKSLKITFAPSTRAGKWALGFIVAFVLFLMIFFVLVNSGLKGGDTFFSNPALAITILISGLSGVAAFVSGLTGMVKFNERSVLVIIATLIGAFVLWWMLAEIFSPH